MWLSRGEYCTLKILTKLKYIVETTHKKQRHEEYLYIFFFDKVLTNCNNGQLVIFSWFWGYKWQHLNLTLACVSCQREILSICLLHWSVIHCWQYNDRITMVSRKISNTSEVSDPEQDSASSEHLTSSVFSHRHKD